MAPIKEMPPLIYNDLKSLPWTLLMQDPDAIFLQEIHNAPAMDARTIYPHDDRRFILQAEGVGQVFHRNISGNTELSYVLIDGGGNEISMTYQMILMQDRVVRLVTYLNDTTGLMGLMTLDGLPPNIDPSDYTHLSVKRLSRKDRADFESDLGNVLKRKASRAYIDINRQHRLKGGDPRHKIDKTIGGWQSEKEMRKALHIPRPAKP